MHDGGREPSDVMTRFGMFLKNELRILKSF